MTNVIDALSIIIPAFNEELMIAQTSQTICELMKQAEIPFRLLIVDDGSRDSSWSLIQKAATTNAHVEGIHFSRNFGKEAAIYAGLCYSQDYACSVIIDCDLQHPPEKIIEMYHLWKNGFEIVEGVKSNRGNESLAHKISAKTFYQLISAATGIDMQRASDFKLLDRKAVLTLINIKEKNAFFRALSSWIGFRTTQIEFCVQERQAGESKWSVKSLVKYAIDNLTSFSTAPISIIVFLGALMFFCSVIFGLITIIQKIKGVAHAGFTTVIILQLFSSSVIMISLGIVGHYIAKIYEEVKCRPKYIISEMCGGSLKNDDNSESSS